MKSKLLLILLALAAVVYFFTLFQHPEGVKPGDPAPLFRVSSGNRTIQLQDYQGKYLLLNFWATWCPPCRAEMPSLGELQKLFADQPFEVIALSIDDDWKSVEQFFEKLPAQLTVGWDRGGEVASQYGTYRLPESYLISPDGKVIKRYIGPRDWVNPKVVSEIRQYLLQ